MILISWSQDKPDQELVDLMLQKASAFYVISGQAKLVYGHRWPDKDGKAADHDRECWHIRDDGCHAPIGSRGVEGCRGLLEGLNAGYELARRQFAPKPRQKKAKPACV
jgi:hypothetical protein